MTRIQLLLLIALLPTASLSAAEPSRWESDIARFEKAAAENPPPAGAVLFVGSSSIRMWNLPKSFPELSVINHGFGGSQVADSLHFADRIILPYKPRTVVVYAGDNDIAAGKSAEQVEKDYRALVAKIHGGLPATKIVFIAIKPSLKRWNLVETMRDANRRIAEFCKSDDLLVYVDIDAPMLGDDKRPRPELFQNDGLHLNAAGYELWAKLVLPHVQSP